MTEGRICQVAQETGAVPKRCIFGGCERGDACRQAFERAMAQHPAVRKAAGLPPLPKQTGNSRP